MGKEKERRMGRVERWLKERDLEIQMQERFERMAKLRWNKRYKEIKTIEIPREITKIFKEEREGK